MADELRISVLVNLGRALWGHVLPDLRGVTLRLDLQTEREARVRCRFLYEGAVGDLQHDCTSEAETELAADYYDDVSIEFVAVQNAARDLEPDEEWVYLRWEPVGDA